MFLNSLITLGIFTSDAKQSCEIAETAKDDNTSDTQNNGQNSDDNNSPDNRPSDGPLVIPNCEQCGEMFDSQIDLRQHEDKVHKQINGHETVERQSSQDSDSDIEMIAEETGSVERPKIAETNTNAQTVIRKPPEPKRVPQVPPTGSQSVIKPNPNQVPKANLINTSPLDFYSISQSIARQLIQNNAQKSVPSVPNTTANGMPVKRLQCTRCGLRFKSEVKCETHLNRDHLNIKPYACNLCATTFYAKDSLSSHMYIKHRMAAFECHVCGHKTTQKMALMLHMGTHTTEKQFKCDLKGCDKTFATRVHLYHHKRNLHNLRVSFGDYCEATSVANLFKHKPSTSQASSPGTSKTPAHKTSASSLNNNTSEEVIYTMCDECDQLFDSDRALTEHTTRVHKKVEPPKQSQESAPKELKTYSKSNGNNSNKIVSFICRECKQFFNNSELFVRHLAQKKCQSSASSHSLSLSLSSPLSVSQSPIAQPLSQRLVVLSSNGRPVETGLEIESNEVVVDMSDNNNQQKNIATVSKISQPPFKPTITPTTVLNLTKLVPKLEYQCNECNMKFDSEHKREIHLNRDHLHTKPFVCDQCDMSFHGKETLYNHLYHKHNIRAFVCHICGHKAGHRSALELHMGRHVTNRPFKCDVKGCDKDFKTKVSLYYHKRGTHCSDEPDIAPTIRPIVQPFPNKLFVCNRPNCERKFKTRAEVTIHQNSHIIRLSCSWPGCQFKADSLTLLFEHKRKEKHMN